MALLVIRLASQAKCAATHLVQALNAGDGVAVQAQRRQAAGQREQLWQIAHRGKAGADARQVRAISLRISVLSRLWALTLACWLHLVSYKMRAQRNKQYCSCAEWGAAQYGSDNINT